jgi:hypothetical protein
MMKDYDLVQQVVFADRDALSAAFLKLYRFLKYMRRLMLIQQQAND